MSYLGLSMSFFLLKEGLSLPQASPGQRVNTLLDLAAYIDQNQEIGT